MSEVPLQVLLGDSPGGGAYMAAVLAATKLSLALQLHINPPLEASDPAQRYQQPPSGGGSGTWTIASDLYDDQHGRHVNGYLAQRKPSPFLGPP